MYTKRSLWRINWVNHNLTCAGCQDPANELHVLSIGCKRRKQWLDNNNGSASIKQTMGGEDCKFFCDLNNILFLQNVAKDCKRLFIQHIGLIICMLLNNEV